MALNGSGNQCQKKKSRLKVHPITNVLHRGGVGGELTTKGLKSGKIKGLRNTGRRGKTKRNP